MSGSDYKVASGKSNSCGYVVVLFQVDPDSVATDLDRAAKATIHLGPQSPSDKRTKLNEEVTSHLDSLRNKEGVLTASLFEAIYFDHGTLDRHPPFGRKGARIAYFDNIIVVKTENHNQASELISEPSFKEMLSSFQTMAEVIDVLAAKNIKMPGEVDRSQAGCFLINFFFAEDVAPLVDVWDSTAGWWQDEGQMANSELLQPTADSHSDYAIINTARWDDVAPAIAAFSKASYGDYVLNHINNTKATTMPSLHRLVA